MESSIQTSKNKSGLKIAVATFCFLAVVFKLLVVFNHYLSSSYDLLEITCISFFAAFAVIFRKKPIIIVIPASAFFLSFFLPRYFTYSFTLFLPPFVSYMRLLQNVFIYLSLLFFILCAFHAREFKNQAGISIGIVIFLELLISLCIYYSLFNNVTPPLLFVVSRLSSVLFPVSLIFYVLSLPESDCQSIDASYDRKNIVLCIILTIITFGLYGVFWAYSICKKIRALNHESLSCIGELCCIIFIPFYSLYWAYTRGEKIGRRTALHKSTITDNSKAYLFLSLFGLNIIVFALMQYDLNQMPAMSNPIFARDPDSVTPIPISEPISTQNENHPDSKIALLKQLSELHIQGVLNDSEYEEKKKDILSRL